MRLIMPAYVVSIDEKEAEGERKREIAQGSKRKLLPVSRRKNEDQRKRAPRADQLPLYSLPCYLLSEADFMVSLSPRQCLFVAVPHSTKRRKEKISEKKT